MTTTIDLIIIMAGFLSVTVASPIQAILWIATTFLLACLRIIEIYNLGFTCSIILMIYIGAIVILFLFIIIIIPVKEQYRFKNSLKTRLLQVTLAVFIYFSIGNLLLGYLRSLLKNYSEFWIKNSANCDFQNFNFYFGYSEVKGVNLIDFYYSDVIIFGNNISKELPFLVLLSGLILFFVLISAILLCQPGNITAPNTKTNYNDPTFPFIKGKVFNQSKVLNSDYRLLNIDNTTNKQL